MINDLKPNQYFVFGSNVLGNHMGGAARQAKEQFGAEDGIGEGLTGQCYAFPTLNEFMGKCSRAELKASRDKLYATCRSLSEKEFLLTAVGTGIAGHPVGFMAELFKDSPDNLILPEEFKC